MFDVSHPLGTYDSDVTGPGATLNNDVMDIDLLVILSSTHRVSCSPLDGNFISKPPLLTQH